MRFLSPIPYTNPVLLLLSASYGIEHVPVLPTLGDEEFCRYNRLLKTEVLNVAAELHMRDVILVVDDEPFVLNIVCCVLENSGFEVLRAASPAEALDIAGRSGPVRLLLSDVVMPGMSGPALAERFAAIHPETEYLFMAGLPDSPEICDRILRRGHAFLAKPFVPRTLLRKVEDVLRKAAAGGQ